MGCVGPTCFCDGYDAALDGPNSSALCLGSVGCRAACDALGDDCGGYMMARTTNRCFLVEDTEKEDADNFHTWTKGEFWPNMSCVNETAFAAESAAELFAKSIGLLTVTERLHVGTDFVVTPGEMTSLEIAGSGLTVRDQVMVIECSDQCGIAESSEAVTMLTTRAVDAKFDAPSVMYGDYAAAPLPTAAVPKYRKEENQFCDGGNAYLKDFPSIVQEHQCYRKCEETAPCLDGACFCDGFFEGHDGPDSTALCLPEAQCESLCARMGVDCYSVDMHRTLPRCFLNGPVCGYLPPTPDANYDILENTGYRLPALPVVPTPDAGGAPGGNLCATVDAIMCATECAEYLPCIQDIFAPGCDQLLADPFCMMDCVQYAACIPDMSAIDEQMGGGGAAVPLPPNEDFGADGATRRMQRMTPRSR